MNQTTSSEWRVPKKLREVELWVHPDGRVVAYLFVHLKSAHHDGEEQPFEIINGGKRFVVVKSKASDEVRFYNRASIVRVEYHDENSMPAASGLVVQRCRLHLMDGCLIEGSLMKSLPPDRSRLFDFLNDENDDFMKVYGETGRITLVNKSYVVCVTTVDD